MGELGGLGWKMILTPGLRIGGLGTNQIWCHTSVAEPLQSLERKSPPKKNKGEKEGDPKMQGLEGQCEARGPRRLFFPKNLLKHKSPEHDLTGKSHPWT